MFSGQDVKVDGVSGKNPWARRWAGGALSQLSGEAKQLRA